MKIKVFILILAASLSALLLPAGSLCAAGPDGKAAYDTFCSGCHPDGKNPQNPAKSLLKINREANGIKGAKDIIRKMRKPGAGMKQFDKKEIPDKTAKAIAEYILKTYK